MEFEGLREAIENIEMVDAHAHSLVSMDIDSTFSSFFQTDSDSFTLSFKRNLRSIAELYGCESSLESVEKYRRKSGLESISSKCFKAAKICALLIDDGLNLDEMLDFEYHKNLVPNVGKILGIENLAHQILNQVSFSLGGNPLILERFLNNLQKLPNGSSWTLDTFAQRFTQKLKSASDNKDIVALKSIAAKHHGLEIDTNVTRKDAEDGLAETLRGGKPVHITNKNLIDYTFALSLENASCLDLPLLIDTGLGYEDLNLQLSNPLHLKSILEDKRYSKCRIVLLHASYPFSKEASYLASVYQQVYLDFGLPVPKLGLHGMVSSIKELLELAPVKKVMFSTDGSASPETFYLGAKRARKAVFSVLRDACIDGDISVAEAIEVADNVFAQNALQFYKINLGEKSFAARNNVYSNHVKGTASEIVDSLVRIIWVDTSGQHRCRVVPLNRFDRITKKNGVGVAVGCMALISAIDDMADESDLTGTGEMRLMPDVSTRRTIPWEKREQMVMADMHIKPGEAWDNCPRQALRRASKILKDEFNLEMNAGFENEFYLLKSVIREGKEEWVPIDVSTYCSTSAYDVVSPVFHEIIAHLRSLDITAEQIHAEIGKGQFEIVLGYDACMSAANDLVFSREVIRAVARRHGLLATFAPKYALDDIGSGSHVHISLSRDRKNVFMGSDGLSPHGMSKEGEEFMAGVFHHLPSILAFTAPIPNSYDRLQPNKLSGAYHCWGKDNREAPLRTACPPGVQDGLVSNFEFKSFDGCANPYLGLAAIIACGIDGVRRHLRLPQPIEDNPADLDANLQMLPKSLSESLEALQNDEVYHEVIGEKLLHVIKGVRKAEIDYYTKHKDAYKLLIHRY